MHNRRRFLQQSSTILGGAALVSAFNNPAFALLKRPFSPADQINIGAIGIAVLFSVLPALRAAMLHPVRALRYE